MTTNKLIHASRAIKLIAALSLLSMTACGSSSGTMVKPEQLSSFSAGKTTYDDVVARLGKPTVVKTASDGTKTASYTHASVKARPETYIPVVGPFVGGADSTAHTVNFAFDRKDVLTGIETQDAAIGSDTL